MSNTTKRPYFGLPSVPRATPSTPYPYFAIDIRTPKTTPVVGITRSYSAFSRFTGRIFDEEPSTISNVSSTTPALEESFDDMTTNTNYYYGDTVVTIMAVLLVLFMLCAIVGNVMVVLTVFRHRGMRTRTNMFIVNLAVADILVAVLDMPVSLTTLLKGDWVLGDGFCKFNGFTMALLLMCSIHTLMYISVHKYISITRPFSRVMTKQKIILLIAASWLWPLLCALTPFFGLTDLVYKRGASQCGPAYPRSLKQHVHSMVISTTNYFIPLGVMVFCYASIFRAIAHHLSRVQATSNIGLHSSVVQQKRITVTLVLVLVCFICCWTPYLAYSMYVNSTKKKSSVPYILNPIGYWFGYMNSACNPIIYAFRSPSFRHGYMEILLGRSVAVVSGEGSTAPKSSSFKNKLAAAVTAEGGESSAVKPATVKAKSRRPKRFLSQTSWVSLPLIPVTSRRPTLGSSGSTNSSSGTPADDSLKKHHSEGDVLAEDTAAEGEAPLHRAVSTILESPKEAEVDTASQTVSQQRDSAGNVKT